MRFRLIDAAKKEFPVQRLCKVLGVSQGGYFAWKDRPACTVDSRSRTWCCWPIFARPLHCRTPTYGSPRMTRELRHDGITIGRHRVARLMRENALQARQRRRFKRSDTDSLHAFPVCTKPLKSRLQPQRGRTRNGVPTSPMSGHARRWLYLAVVIDLFARRVVGWSRRRPAP